MALPYAVGNRYPCGFINVYEYARAPRARACNRVRVSERRCTIYSAKFSACKLSVHTAVTTAVARLAHNDASHDGQRERRLTAAHSILAGAVAPHQDAQEAF